jgi:small subunit ribosomal protein S3
VGQKVHPIGFRLGVTKDWQAKWYADKHYTELLQEDLKIRDAIESKHAEADISRIEIERAANQVTVTVYTARPGIVIGRGGQRVDEMRLFLEGVTGKRIRLNIQEIRQPELDAYLVASNIAHQMERRISHRRAMKQAIQRAMESGAQGIKVTCSGRLTGSEYSRRETLHQGRVPLHTLRADIDYAIAEAHTTLGRSGVKVWIYKGDILPETKMPPIEELPPGGVMAWGEGESVEVHDEVDEEKPPVEVRGEVEEEKPAVKVRAKTEEAKPPVGVHDEVEEEKASAEVLDEVEEEKPREEQQAE